MTFVPTASRSSDFNNAFDVNITAVLRVNCEITPSSGGVESYSKPRRANRECGSGEMESDNRVRRESESHNVSCMSESEMEFEKMGSINPHYSLWTGDIKSRSIQP
jgi:hypothetical protein